MNMPFFLSTSTQDSKTVGVDATKGWVSTGVTVPPCQEVSIAYQSGTWTADKNINTDRYTKYYDAGGSPDFDVPENQPKFPIIKVPWGALVGRINGGEPFFIGADEYMLMSQEGGELELSINDDLDGDYGDGLSDNGGSIQVEVTVYSNQNADPDFSEPLVAEPAQSSPEAPTSSLGPLKHLIGTWTNQVLPGTGKGGRESPYSYNVMPLPQKDASRHFILKNFRYYEELTFSAIHGKAPNRGGSGQQTAYTLFYEQRVYFAEGPNKDALVHAENGSLLFLVGEKQPEGPYGNGDFPGIGNQIVPGSTAPVLAYNLVKQVSVPHGNSILAIGNYDDGSNKCGGVPDIPKIDPLPSNPDDQRKYHIPDPVSNPDPVRGLNPNLALNEALDEHPCNNYIVLSMSAKNGEDSSGSVTNIGFEQQHAKVTGYDCTYWLESFDGGASYTQLQYSQTIHMSLSIDGEGQPEFPHVTVNTLTKMKDE